MCLLFAILFLGPRFGLIVYWIGWPARWDLAFDTWVWPFLGFLIAPWTTLAWVLCAPGGIEGFDYFLIGMAILVDVLTVAGNGGSYRRRATSAAPGAPTY
jgi:hypothetical protein